MKWHRHSSGIMAEDACLCQSNSTKALPTHVEPWGQLTLAPGGAFFSLGVPPGRNSLNIFYFAGTAGRPAFKDLRNQAEALLVSLRDFAPETLTGTAPEQIDRTPPESPACHPGSQNAINAYSFIYQKIQLRAAHFVVVLQTQMRFDHQLAHTFQLSPA